MTAQKTVQKNTSRRKRRNKFYPIALNTVDAAKCIGVILLWGSRIVDIST